jgi:hypothetical protein
LLASSIREPPVFEEFMGVPLHPLLVHAPVVFIPLLSLVAVAYALVPFLRPHTRLVLGALALVTPLATLFAKLAGDAFYKRLDARGLSGGDLQGKIEAHRHFGTLTVYATVALAIIALVLVYMVAPRQSMAAAADGFTASARPAPWPSVLTILAVAGAIVALYYVVRTGDSGSKAVWTGF